VLSIADELEKLRQLHESGAIDDHEYSSAKARILNGPSPQAPAKAALLDEFSAGSVTTDDETRRWAFLLHLSVLAGFALPIAGLTVPIVIWQLKKPELPGIDAHGINALNWIMSLMLYSVVGIVLIFAIIGIPILMVLGTVAIVFPIIAAIKANNGELWKYPLSISFLKQHG
jgi:uncharacterized protein